MKTNVTILIVAVLAAVILLGAGCREKVYIVPGGNGPGVQPNPGPGWGKPGWQNPGWKNPNGPWAKVPPPNKPPWQLPPKFQPKKPDLKVLPKPGPQPPMWKIPNNPGQPPVYKMPPKFYKKPGPQFNPGNGPILANPKFNQPAFKYAQPAQPVNPKFKNYKVFKP